MVQPAVVVGDESSESIGFPPTAGRLLGIAPPWRGGRGRLLRVKPFDGAERRSFRVGGECPDVVASAGQEGGGLNGEIRGLRSHQADGAFESEVVACQDTYLGYGRAAVGQDRALKGDDPVLVGCRGQGAHDGRVGVGYGHLEHGIKGGAVLVGRSHPNAVFGLGLEI